MKDCCINERKISEVWQYLTPEEKKELTELAYYIDEIEKEWKPLPGPQTLALETKADIILYGGAAGGGKSYLAIGKALTQHKRVLILRREFPQLAGLLETAKEVYEPYGNYVGNPQPTFRLKYKGIKKLIEFGSCQHDKDKEKYQGRAHDLRVLDEAANFLESQVDFIAGWVRSEDQNQKCQLLLLSNPPTSSQGQWLFEWFAPWIDKKHPNPAAPGELRWFAKIKGKDCEVSDSRQFVLDGENIIYDFNASAHSADNIISPKSRTFIPARVTDNPYYVKSGYISTLQAMPEPLRSQMLYGDFLAGQEDDAWQLFPTAWVRLAQERWRTGKKPDLKLSQIGVDVARGGIDKTVITLRYGSYIEKQLVYPGSVTPDGKSTTALIAKELKNPCDIVIDVIGYGSSALDSTRDFFNKSHFSPNIYAFNGSMSTSATDKTKMFEFLNQRAEFYWKLREALDPETGQNIALPDDRELLSDLCSTRWEVRGNKIRIEAKDEIIKRIGRSPDKADSLIYAFVTQKSPPRPAYINVIER